MDYIVAAISLVVGLFVGQFVMSIVHLFGVAGPLVTAIFVTACLLVFWVLEKLRKHEMQYLLRFIGRVLAEPVSVEAIKEKEAQSRLSRRFVLIGAVAGAVVAQIFGLTFLSDLLPF